MSRYTNRPRKQEFQISELVAGDYFVASERFEGVADTNTKTLVLENNHSENGLFLVEPTVRSSGQVFATTEKNISIDTAGASVDFVNKKTNATDNPGDYNASKAGDNETGVISGGIAFNSITTGSGSNSANAQPGVSAEDGILALIMPNDTVAISGQNQSGSTQDISITAGAIEIDGDILP